MLYIADLIDALVTDYPKSFMCFIRWFLSPGLHSYSDLMRDYLHSHHDDKYNITDA